MGSAEVGVCGLRQCFLNLGVGGGELLKIEDFVYPT